MTSTTVIGWLSQARQGHPLTLAGPDGPASSANPDRADGVDKALKLRAYGMGLYLVAAWLTVSNGKDAARRGRSMNSWSAA